MSTYTPEQNDLRAAIKSLEEVKAAAKRRQASHEMAVTQAKGQLRQAWAQNAPKSAYSIQAWLRELGRALDQEASTIDAASFAIRTLYEQLDASRVPA